MRNERLLAGGPDMSSQRKNAGVGGRAAVEPFLLFLFVFAFHLFRAPMEQTSMNCILGIEKRVKGSVYF